MLNRTQEGRSYANIRNGRVPYDGILVDANSEIVKKRPIKSYPNCPAIGSLRYPNPNFEKREVEMMHEPTYTAALVMDKAYHFMSTTELRVEDYYLLRTSPVGSSLFNSVVSSGNSFMPPFNHHLHCSISHLTLPQPDLNRPWPLTQNSLPNPTNPPPALTNSQTSNFQTPADRLAFMRKNPANNDLANSVRVLQ
jgi:hypothetical protein